MGRSSGDKKDISHKPINSVWSSENLKRAIAASLVVGVAALWISGFMLFRDIPEGGSFSIEARVRVATLIVTVVFAVVTFFTVMYRNSVLERQAAEAKRDNDAAERKENAQVFENGIRYIKSEDPIDITVGCALLRTIVDNSANTFNQHIADAASLAFQNTFPKYVENQSKEGYKKLENQAHYDTIQLLQKLSDKRVNSRRSITIENDSMITLPSTIMRTWFPIGRYFCLDILCDLETNRLRIIDERESYELCRFQPYRERTRHAGVYGQVGVWSENFVNCDFRELLIHIVWLRDNNSFVDCCLNNAIIHVYFDLDGNPVINSQFQTCWFNEDQPPRLQLNGSIPDNGSPFSIADLIELTGIEGQSARELKLI